MPVSGGGVAGIIPHAFVPVAGARVCASTVYSGQVCGTVTEPAAE